MKYKIVIPTDFSEMTFQVISNAINIFSKQRCEFYLLNCFSLGRAYNDLVMPESDDEIYSKAKESAENSLSKILQRLTKENKNPIHTYYTVSKYNDILDALGELIEEKDIELVVLGTSGEEDSSLGEHTLKIIEHIRNCPILAIPEGLVVKKKQEIVFLTEYQIPVKRRELQYLMDIASFNRSPVRILYVSGNKELTTTQQNNRRLLEEYFSALENSFHHLDNPKVEMGLASFVKGKDIGIIAFMNTDHSVLGSLFTKPMIKKIGSIAKFPVLALHDFIS